MTPTTTGAKHMSPTAEADAKHISPTASADAKYMSPTAKEASEAYLMFSMHLSRSQ